MNEALRLADYMDDALNDPNDVADAVSAELRRLSAENKRLHQRHRDDNVEYTRVLAQRDALLEACRAMLTFIERHAPRGLQPEPGSPVAKARAAIKAVEDAK